jgi:heme o synthase
METSYKPVSKSKIIALQPDWRAFTQIIVQLFKLRIVALLLFTALGGAFLGNDGLPDLGQMIVLVITGGMAAAGASALNQYLERESDKAMQRTRSRPLPSGKVRPSWVLASGLILIALPVMTVLPFNPALAFFLLLGAIIYVMVYTIWLKPRTTLNIVIGGAAGSMAVMSGGAAVGQWQDPGVIVLASLVFLWTPAHFWSLAIMCRDDYKRAALPMLSAQVSVHNATFWILLHIGAMVLVSLLLALVPSLGNFYALVATLASFYILRYSLRFLQERSQLNARSLFIASNIYLMIIILAICFDALF